MLKSYYFYIIISIILVISIIYFYCFGISGKYIYVFKIIIDNLPFHKFIKQFLYLVLLKLKPNKHIPRKRHVSHLKKKIVASNQRWKCRKCQQLLDYTYEIDHIQPLSQGGSNELTNLQALCRNCHGKKTLLSYLDN